MELSKLENNRYFETRTRGVEISNIELSNGWIPLIRESMPARIFDHGGQDEFHVLYNNLFHHPLSLFVLVLPIVFVEMKDNSGFVYQVKSTPEYLENVIETLVRNDKSIAA